MKKVDWKGVEKSTNYLHRKTKSVVTVIKLNNSQLRAAPLQVNFFFVDQPGFSHWLDLDTFVGLYKKV